MKKKLTPTQLAALAAGATLEAVLASGELEAGPPDEDDASQGGLFAEQVAALTAELATSVASAAGAAEKLTAVEAELEALKVTSAALTAELEAAQAASTSMSGTILERVKNMSVALNAKAPETCDDPVELVRLHAELDAKFQEKFKASRVSAATTAPAAKAIPLWTAAQLDAARSIPVYN